MSFKYYKREIIIEHQCLQGIIADAYFATEDYVFAKIEDKYAPACCWKEILPAEFYLEFKKHVNFDMVEYQDNDKNELEKINENEFILSVILDLQTIVREIKRTSSALEYKVNEIDETQVEILKMLLEQNQNNALYEGTNE